MATNFTGSERFWNDVGVWGPVTATLDWCETNYQFSRYVAEMANSFSNVITVGLALLGVWQAHKESFPARYFGCYLGCALVGLGSFAFHATLLFEAQLADELPMIYCSAYCVFLLFDTKPGFSLIETGGWKMLASSITFDLLFTWSYMAYRNPVYHQIVFAAVLLTSTARATYILHFNNVLPKAVKSEIHSIFNIGAGTFVFGFFVWNLDNIFCNTITRWKYSLGWPAAFLLEGHSWWHVFTGLGTYLMLVGVTYLTLCIKDDHQRYNIATVFGLPYVERANHIKRT